MIKKMWEKWKRLSIKAGNFQANIVLWFFYWLLLAPFAVAVKIFSDPLNLKKRTPSWDKREPQKGSLSEMKDQ